MPGYVVPVLLYFLINLVFGENEVLLQKRICLFWQGSLSIHKL